MAEKILSIETSTEVCSVALHVDGSFKAEERLDEGMSHSKMLGLLTDRLLNENDLNSSDLSAVAISNGPGSYTGLRIGASFAKGLCFAHRIPLISVDTLTALTMQAMAMDDGMDIYIPMMDARRMEVYHAVFDAGLNSLKPTEALIVEEGVFDDFGKSSKIGIFGNGMEKCREVLGSDPLINFINGIHCSAKEIGDLAVKKYEKEEFEDLVYYEPFYLKEFVAKPSKKLL